MSGLAQTTFDGGFKQPVHDAQVVFASIMRAMSRPGLVENMSTDVTPPSPLNIGAALAALTLCNADTFVWLDGGLQQAQVEDWLRFHCSAQITSDKSQAQFCFLSDPSKLSALPSFAQGTQEYPDRSATVIVQVDGFNDRPHWTLTGPGIETHTGMEPLGMSSDFLDIWSANNAQFPRGCDVIFVSNTQLVALPRTTKISKIDNQVER